MHYICFQPIYQERVWGGRDFEKKLGRTLPSEKIIGESWEIVDRAEAQSTIKEGKFEGLTIRQAIKDHSGSIMGPDYPPERPFPVLVKWLDCQQKLSLQVHPPADIAPLLNGEPKTENWYIADATSTAALMAGLKNGVTRKQFEKALNENKLSDLVHRISSKKGDSLFVPSGRIHAIDAGNLILEIQQNSDTTYRVYDWGRVGIDGKPRQLHVEESMKSIDFDDFEPNLITSTLEKETLLADCENFRLRKLTLNKNETVNFNALEQPRLFHVVEGHLVENSTDYKTLITGDNILLPYDSEFVFQAKCKTTVLITDNFISY